MGLDQPLVLAKQHSVFWFIILALITSLQVYRAYRFDVYFYSILLAIFIVLLLYNTRRQPAGGL